MAQYIRSRGWGHVELALRLTGASVMRGKEMHLRLQEDGTLQ